MTSSNGRPHFTPWDERALPRAISVEESARRAGIYAAIEERLAALLEQWSNTLDGDARTVLGRHARNHAWHVSLLREQLSDGADAGGEPPKEVAAFLDALGSPSGPEQAVELLTGVYRVALPRVIAAYTYWVRALGTAAAESDGRWFEFILKDLFDSVRDGELLLQALLDADAAVQRSADRRTELEQHLVSAGGLAGPDTLGAVSAQEVTSR